MHEATKAFSLHRQEQVNVTRSLYHDETLSTSAGRICRARMQLNRTIKEISQATGLSEKCISDVENNKQRPSLPTLRRFSHILKVSVSYLGCFEEYPDHTLGQKIRKARLYHGLTQVEMSRLLGVWEKTLRSWETDQIKPCQQNLDALSCYFTILNE